ncbi:hypothetical protein D3C76_1458320 [compost metagenome]
MKKLIVYIHLEPYLLVRKPAGILSKEPKITGIAVVQAFSPEVSGISLPMYAINEEIRTQAIKEITRLNV